MGRDTNPRRSPEGLIIPEGFYFEVYVPKAGRIYSTVVNKFLKYAKICLSADADVTFKDVRGNQINAFSLSKGEHSFLVTEIITVSAGSVAVIHDGIIAEGYE